MTMGEQVVQRESCGEMARPTMERAVEALDAGDLDRAN